MGEQIPAETLAEWRADANRGSFGVAAAKRILALLDALDAATARAERAEAKVERATAMRDEWQRDATEYLNTVGQHASCSIERMAELLTAALADQEDR